MAMSDNQAIGIIVGGLILLMLAGVAGGLWEYFIGWVHDYPPPFIPPPEKWPRMGDGDDIEEMFCRLPNRRIFHVRANNSFEAMEHPNLPPLFKNGVISKIVKALGKGKWEVIVEYEKTK